MFDYIDSIPDLQFFSIYIGMLVATFVAEWIAEDNARVVNLQKHFYDIAMSTDVSPPKAPTGVKPNYGAPSEPKVRYFQDAGRNTTTGMGYDARRAERGK